MARGTPAERILLGGFSQGGAMTYYAGLTYPKTLGGLFVLSGFLPLRSEFPGIINAANKHTPVFVAHGTQDPLLPHTLGRMSADIVAGAGGGNIAFHTYPMAHSVHPRELAELRAWIATRVPPAAPQHAAEL